MTSFYQEVGTTVTDVENSPGELCSLLRNFYAGARQSNAQLYSGKSMITIRYRLQRYFLRQFGVDIINNVNFKPANDVFSAMRTRQKMDVSFNSYCCYTSSVFDRKFCAPNGNIKIAETCGYFNSL